MSKTSTKSAPESKAPKAEKTERARKEGLRTGQIRILEVLNKSKRPLTKNAINEACAKAGFETAKKFSQWMADPLGSRDPETSKAAEARCGYKSLLTLKFVKPDELDIDGKTEVVYGITAAGKAALARAKSGE